MSINDREYWIGSTKWTIHRNWQRISHKTKNKNQTKTNKKRIQSALDATIRKQTQITLIRHGPSYKLRGGKDDPTIICMRKSQHGTQNVKTHNRRAQKAKKMGNTILMTGKSFVKALHLWVQSVFINIDRNLTVVFNKIKTNLNKC